MTSNKSWPTTTGPSDALSRRRFLGSLMGGAALIAGGGAALTACGGRAGSAGGGAGSGQLSLNLFGGTFQDAVEQKVIAPFEQKEGAKVSVTTAISNDALTKLKAAKDRPTLDVAYMDPAVLLGAKREGLLQKLALDSMQSPDELYDIAVDPEGYWVAELVAMTGLAYNTEHVKNPPRSWQDLWATEYQGKVAVPDVSGTAGYQFLVQAASMNGGSEDDIDPGFAAIAKLKPSLAAIYKTPDEMSKLLSSGEAWIGPWYNDRFNQLKQAGAPVGFVAPEEGGLAILSATCVPKAAANPDLAQKYIDFQVSAKINKAYCVEMQEGPTNRSVDLPPKLERAEIPYGQDEIDELVSQDSAKISLHLSDWISRWQREIAG